MSKTKAYEISEDTFSGVIARMVEKFKAENPGVGEAKFTCHDGSTVIIKINNRPTHTKKPAKARS